MITCPVCRHPNDDFSITCTACGSYIQDRVPTIDYFSMVWNIIESPSAALKKIIIAEHKNFVLFHATLLGIAAMFTLMWVSRSGDNYDNLLPLLFFGTAVGVLIGIPLFFAMIAGIHLGAKILRGTGSWKGTYGVLGWSLLPAIVSVVIVLPIEVATLGLYLFTSSPTAFQVKPEVFSVLAGLDIVFALWSLALCVRGTAMLHRLSLVVSFVLVGTVVTAVSLTCYYLYSSFTI